MIPAESLCNFCPCFILRGRWLTCAGGRDGEEAVVHELVDQALAVLPLRQWVGRGRGAQQATDAPGVAGTQPVQQAEERAQQAL
jgi:hypothetical protein